jgi:sugar lactone lactonase YvrE
MQESNQTARQIQLNKGENMYTTGKSQRHILATLLLIVLSLTLMGSRPMAPFPSDIPLPNGFQPEGIARGTGTTFYVGSIPTGAIYRGDFLTGEGEILVPPQPGRSATGLKYDPRTNLLFVSGAMTGKAFVYDAGTGELVAELQLSTQPSFINDVIITRDAAYFTNSFLPEIYRVSFSQSGSAWSFEAQTIPLGGEYQSIPGGFNANGIAATPDGKTLIIVNSSEGALYRVDPQTGIATRIDLGTGNVLNGDGILLQGKTLYVVQNSLNQIAVISLSSNFSSGTIQSLLTSPLFRVPTTISRFGDTLYAVNARFDTPPTPETDYDVVRVPLN